MILVKYSFTRLAALWRPASSVCSSFCRASMSSCSKRKITRSFFSYQRCGQVQLNTYSIKNAIKATD